MLSPILLPFPTLHTEHLTLRQIMPDDAAALFVMRSDEATMQHIHRPIARSVEDTAKLIDIFTDALNTHNGITWGISLKDDPTLIGTIGYWRIMKEDHRAEIGYMLHKDLQGRGLMSEALKTVIDYGFGVMKLHTIEAQIIPQNNASVSLVERHGFVREGHFKDNHIFNGIFYDSFVYTLLNPAE